MNLNSKPDTTPPPASYKSQVWKHFDILSSDSKKVVCKKCLSIITYKSGSTSAMAKHLKGIHSVGMTDEANPAEGKCANGNVPNHSQSTITDAFAKQAKFRRDSQQTDKCNRAVAMFIAKDLRPFSVVENAGFKTLCNTLEPRYSLPSRPYISQTLIPLIYNELKTKLKAKIKSAEFVSITTDGWSSRANQSYNTVTAHLINKEWKLESYVLTTELMEKSHTGVNLCNFIEAVLDEWSIQKETTTCTTDNAANITLAVELLGVIHIRCYAHTLNLATQKSLKLPQVSRLLAKIRKIVTFFHKSTTAAELLKRKQAQLDLPTLKLISDCETRWNSTLHMITRYLQNQPAIYAVFRSDEIRQQEKEYVTLSEGEINTMEQIVQVTN